MLLDKNDFELIDNWK